MTTRTTTLKGADAGRYYVESELDYYLDSGEPPGRWRGAGTALLGLHGTVDDEDFLAVMDGLDPGTRRLLGTAHTDATARGFDVTCSAPKSVSVLFAIGDPDTRRAVLDAHDAAVDAVVDWIELHAHCRYRVDSEVCTFDAEGIVAAVFRQHTSRSLDPQVHTHVVIPNRVRSPDGRWLALDARTIKRDQRTLSRLYHAGLRAELTARLGVRWSEPDNGIAEIRDVSPDVLGEFSQRTDAIDERLAEKLDALEDELGRSPTPRERWRLEREAVLETRPTKAQAELHRLEATWVQRVAALGLTPDELVAEATHRVRGRTRLESEDVGHVADTAIDALSEGQSTWRVAEVVRELAAAVPTDVAATAAHLVAHVDRLADDVIATRTVDLSRPIPDGVALRWDGRPVTESVVDRVLSTSAIVAQEERLLALAEQRMKDGGADRNVKGLEGLTLPQQHLAAAVAGQRALVIAVGPAGTGKTTALAPAVEQLRCDGRAVFGVAPSAAAAEVLAVEAGIDADTLDKLLVEHRLDRPPEHRYDLPAGATVIVDEAAMVPKQRLAEVFELADRRDWRLVLVGDPLQFSAAGRSGMFGLLAETFDRIELDKVHRFRTPWEAEASLRLRRGDTDVVDLYEEHGRLHGGSERSMRSAAVRTWWEAIQRGETATLTAPTNASVLELNRLAQQRRIDAGQLDPSAPTLDLGACSLHIGDVVATRQNARQLRTDRKLMVKNRDRWVVDAIERDGAVVVSGRTGRVRLPAEYVSEHAELAYAETSHASQGRTVDRSILYLDRAIGAAGIYVPLTRGRASNEAFVVMRGEDAPADVVADCLSRDWIDQPATVARLDRSGRTDSGAELLSASALRHKFSRIAEIDAELSRIDGQLIRANRRYSNLTTSVGQLERRVADETARLQHACETLDAFDRAFKRRRHRPEVDAARRLVEWLPGSIREVEHGLASVRAEVPAGRRAVDRATEALGEKKAWWPSEPECGAHWSTMRYAGEPRTSGRLTSISTGSAELLASREVV